MTQAPAFLGDAYVAPFPPRAWRADPLIASLIAAVVAVNICAVSIGVRLGTFTDLPVLHTPGITGRIVPPVLPAATHSRLAVLDPPTWQSAPPLQLATLTEQARQMSAELKGSEAAGVIDAIDPENSVAAVDTAPACIDCDTLPVRAPVDIVPVTPGDDAGEPEIPAGYDAGDSSE